MREPATDPAQDSGSSGFPLQLLRTIDTASARPGTAFQAFDTLALNIADLRGDGRLEIVSLNDNLRAYVLDPLTGKVLAEIDTPRPDGWGARDINSVAIGDATGDGKTDLAILNSAASMTIYTLDEARSSASRFVFSSAWSTVVTAVGLDTRFYDNHPWIARGSQLLGADGNPYIAHLDDGTPVVLAQSDGYPAHIAYNAEGNVHWYTDYWDGNSGPWAGKMRPDGHESAVFATDGGHVVAYDVASGAIRWDFDGPAHGAKPGSISIMPTVLDLRGDGTKSIFVGARVAVDDKSDGWMLRQHAKYFLLDPNGKLLWQASFDWGNPGIYTHPAAVDLNADGVKDIVALDWNTIGHVPGNWEKLGPANLFAIDGATGDELWHREVDAQWSNTGIVAATFIPGKPGPQFMTEEQVGLRDGISIFGPNGERQAWVPLPDAAMTIRRGAVLADLDGDGRAEAVIPVSSNSTNCPNPLDVGCRAGALLVYKTQATNDSVVFDNNELFDSQAPAGLAMARN